MLANKIISIITDETKEADFDALSVAKRAEQLLALFDRKNSVLALDEKREIVRPQTSLAQSSLFTGVVHEPQMFTELKKEVTIQSPTTNNRHSLQGRLYCCC